jgi:hypothetical protein
MTHSITLHSRCFVVLFSVLPQMQALHMEAETADATPTDSRMTFYSG